MDEFTSKELLRLYETVAGLIIDVTPLIGTAEGERLMNVLFGDDKEGQKE